MGWPRIFGVRFYFFRLYFNSMLKHSCISFRYPRINRESLLPIAKTIDGEDQEGFVLFFMYAYYELL